MPGYVSACVSAAVLPWRLCQSFVRANELPISLNQYANGEVQTLSLASAPRLSWRLAQRLIPADMAALLAFYQARLGTVQVFTFYDVFFTSPLFTYDPTGAASVGRYYVRFDSGWEHSIGLCRGDVQYSLIQVA